MLFADGLHYTPDGHAMVARIMEERVHEMLVGNGSQSSESP